MPDLPARRRRPAAGVRRGAQVPETIRTGATWCSSTNTSTATTARASAPATRPAGPAASRGSSRRRAVADEGAAARPRGAARRHAASERRARVPDGEASGSVDVDGWGTDPSNGLLCEDAPRNRSARAVELPSAAFPADDLALHHPPRRQSQRARPGAQRLRQRCPSPASPNRAPAGRWSRSHATALTRLMQHLSLGRGLQPYTAPTNLAHVVWHECESRRGRERKNE